MGSPHPTDVIWVARSRDSRHVKTLTILLAKIRGSAGCSLRGRTISLVPASYPPGTHPRL